jgi:hypothetical protein
LREILKDFFKKIAKTQVNMASESGQEWVIGQIEEFMESQKLNVLTDSEIGELFVLGSYANEYNSPGVSPSMKKIGINEIIKESGFGSYSVLEYRRFSEKFIKAYKEAKKND